MSILIDINFTPYIPTTVIGLLGLVFGYLYFYFKNKDDNKLKELESINPEERKKTIEARLNEIGTSIDTSKLTSQQKYNLLVQSMNVKTRKYLIISVTTIILAGIVYFLLQSSPEKKEVQMNTFFRDFDNDGFGDKNNTKTAELQPAGYVTNDQDCCDSNSSVHLALIPEIPKKIFTRGDVEDYYQAALNGNLELVKNYIQLGMPVDTQLTNLNAALPNAAAYGQTKIVKFLLDKGSNPNQRFVAEASFIGSTSLIQASYSNFIDIVDLLIKNKADLNMGKADGDAMTALMFACVQGNSEIVRKLLDAGALPNIQRASNKSTAKNFALELASPKKEEILNILNLFGAKTREEL